MGIKETVQKAGFDTVHIRQKKDDKGNKMPDVYLIWATKDKELATV